ncbi:3-phosphoinositide-dependent protein kinase-1-putative [Striga hermonthica]|uniref:3-phosphoinositide-dependent protein kinase-1-putative n=1 Tax=Striga hermonthica TaxID=68872 RepID=A0A9N7RQR1_STRHE|nr:3-phosphoinositide-dependent protein kinase-1-putative [Striga hermonthica]
MATTHDQTTIWEEIDRAENYLVCCMFDEAAALASSVINRLLRNLNSSKDSEGSEDFENDWDDMSESAGMVFVQALKQSRRTSEIWEELKLVFGSVNAIPVRVIVTGVCLQMSESLSTTAQGFLEEFLDNWLYVGDRYYPRSGSVDSASGTEGSSFMFPIGVHEYFEVVELYVITLLATTLNEMDLAISWAEKAMLPIEKRQELLRRLESINSSVTSSSQKSISTPLSDQFFSGDREQHNEQQQQNVESKFLPSRMNITAKDEILKLSQQRAPHFWWSRNIRLKVGNTELVVANGKLLMASLLLLMYYFTRKKQAALKRFLFEKAGFVKKALADLWQLAFSYQVNPLAAVQTLPTSTRGNH